MADEKPDPWQHWRPLIVWSVVTIVTAVVSAILGVQYAPVPPPVVVQVEKPADPEAWAQTFGWVKDDDAIARNVNPLLTAQFQDTPAGRAVMGDGDVFLWQAVRKVNPDKPAGWYPNINQQNVGCCVGCGFKHACGVIQATQILAGRAAEWKEVSVEVIYGGSRVEIGGGRISGDGSIGAWAARWVREYGVVPMEKYDSVDLSEFSPKRAREFGRYGVPDDLEPLAKQHPVKGTALVKSWQDVERAIRQGYPVAVCSDQGFRMERDRDGFCRAQGTWPHCMAIIGIRGGDRPGGFILNSWGDNAHTGPVWPTDAPVAGFWADWRTIDRMVKQGDSFALSDAVGFPQRKLPDDWFIRAVPRNRAQGVIARFPLPEVRLSW